MGYNGPYSLSARCLSEFIADVLFAFVGLSVFANALLNKTKGNAMGYLAMVLGLSGAQAVAIVVLGFISAWGNPCIMLGLWITGTVSAQDFFAISCCQVAGCFVGACLMWWAYLPHFKTVPEPPPVEPEDQLLRSTDYQDTVVLKYASYSSHPRRSIGAALKDVVYYISPHTYLQRMSGGADAAAAPKYSKQLATAQTEGKTARLKGLLRMQPRVSSSINNGSPKDLEAGNDEQLLLCAMYEAAIVADQNTKLTVFCTRPAVFSPVFNWSMEFLGTCGIVFCGLFIAVTSQQIVPLADAPTFPYEAGVLIGLLLAVFGLGCGGPTGLAANPARDLGPRLAHWVLPISGKGRSEWEYAWVPISGPLAGATVGSYLYLLVNKLDRF